MAIVKNYDQNSETYQNLIEAFLNKFELYFSNSNIKREQIKKLFLQNLKTVKKHEGVNSFKKPLIGRLNGVYNRLTKELEYTDYDEATIFHEMFHALSNEAVSKRDSIIKFMAVIYLGQKQLSVREFEEGMTEYLTTCINSEAAKHVRFNYSQETTIVNKLAKIYGDDMILEYYLGFNNNLVNAMDQDLPNAFRDVVRLCQKTSTNEETPVPFESTKYYNKNGEVIYDDLMFELFSKKKLVEVKSIDDFKHNLKELFSFYESDLYKLCYEIADIEERIQDARENNDENLVRYNQHLIEEMARLLKSFDGILKVQWKKLMIDDEELYNNLVLDEIEMFNAFATPIIIDYLDYWNNDISFVYKNRMEKNNTDEVIDVEKNVTENVNDNANSYVSNVSSSPTSKIEFNFSGSVGVSTDDSQTMEYMPTDLDGASKEQLQMLREKITQEYSVDDSRKNGR